MQRERVRPRIESWLDNADTANSIPAPPAQWPQPMEQQSTISSESTFRSTRFSQRRVTEEVAAKPQPQHLPWPPHRRKIDDLAGLPHPPDRPTAFWKARRDQSGRHLSNKTPTAKQVAHWNAAKASFGTLKLESFVEPISPPRPVYRPSRFQRCRLSTHSNGSSNTHSGGSSNTRSDASSNIRSDASSHTHSNAFSNTHSPLSSITRSDASNDIRSRALLSLIHI